MDKIRDKIFAPMIALYMMLIDIELCVLFPVVVFYASHIVYELLWVCLTVMRTV